MCAADLDLDEPNIQHHVVIATGYGGTCRMVRVLDQQHLRDGNERCYRAQTQDATINSEFFQTQGSTNNYESFHGLIVVFE